MPSTEHPLHTLYCSFCGKSQHEVATLVCGPTVFICDECVELSMSMCLDRARTKDGEPRSLPRMVNANDVIAEDNLTEITRLQMLIGAGVQKEENLIHALKKARDRFQFYAENHAKQGKTEKAQSNLDYFAMCQNAIDEARAGDKVLIGAFDCGICMHTSTTRAEFDEHRRHHAERGF